MKRLLLSLLILFGLQGATLAATCGSFPFTLQNNTTADATQVMANFNTVRNCIINNAAGSGVNTDITSITGLSTPLSVPQGGTPVFIGTTSTGTANAQVVATTTPIGYSLTNGYRITFTAGATNTGATTLNVNSTGATAVRRNSASGLEALTGGEIVSGDIIEAIYNGTFFVLLSGSGSGGAGGFGPSTNITAGTTVDLGTIGSHNANITSSGVSIASFGSTASTAAPVYLIKFADVNTLVYNATSMIIPGSGNITTAAEDTALVTYLGSSNWQVLSYTRRTGAGIIPVTPLCGASGLTIANNAGTPNTNLDVAATQAVMQTTAFVPITATTVAVTINFTTTGANGLDAGALNTSRWYHIYLISNGTTTAGLGSLSTTAPTMPSGYVYKCRIGAFATDSSSNFYRQKQVGPWAGRVVTAATNTLALCEVAAGVLGTYSTTAPSWSTQTVTGNGFCAPTTAAAAAFLQVTNYKAGASAAVQLAPNASYGGSQNANGAAPPIDSSAAPTLGVHNAEFNLEATTVQLVHSAAGGGTLLQRWRDTVNAN